MEKAQKTGKLDKLRSDKNGMENKNKLGHV